MLEHGFGLGKPAPCSNYVVVWVPNIKKQSLFGVETYDELPTPTLKYTAKREKRRFSDPDDLFHFNRYKGETCLNHLVSSRGTF